MTFGELINKLSEEMVEEASKDEAKSKVLEEFGAVMEEGVSNGGKINLGKLFDISDKFIKTFPEYSAALLATCFLGGISAESLEVDDVNQVSNLNVEDFTDGINIEGEGDT